MEVFEVFAKMSLQDLISNPLQKIQAQMKGSEGSAQTLTSKIAGLGKAMLPLAIGAGVVLGAFGSTIAVAAEFEQTMAKTSTMFGDVAVDSNKLNTDILNLSKTFGISANEIGSSYYNALSAGIPVTEDMADATKFMESSLRLAKSGFTDVDTAVTTTAKIMNAYKMDVSEIDNVHKILMQTQNNGITTVGELGASLAQVTPTAAAMGVTFNQVGAALASMTSAGTPTAQATTQLNGLLAELGKSGTQAQKAMLNAMQGTEFAGLSFQDLMAKGVPLNDILDKMGAFANKSGKSLLDMFSSIDAGKGALSISGLNSATFTKNLDAMATSADVVGIAYEKVTDTLSFQTDRFKTTITSLKITIGSLFLPVLKVFTNVLSSVVQVFEWLSSTTVGSTFLKIIAVVASFVIGITALIGVFLMLKLAIAPIIATIIGLKAVVVSIISALVALKVAILPIIITFVSAAAPLLLIIGAIALLYLAFRNNFMGITDVVKNFWDNIKLVVNGVISIFQSLKGGVGSIKGELAEKIEVKGLLNFVTAISKYIYKVSSLFNGVIAGFKSNFAEVIAILAPTAAKVGEIFSIIGGAISFVMNKLLGMDISPAADSWASFGNILSIIVVGALKVVAEGISFLATLILHIFKSIGAFATFFSDIFNGVSFFESGKKLILTLIEGMLSVISKPKDILMSGLESLRKLLPFSDAKEGPLSRLTLSGESMMTTLAEGVKIGSTPLINTTTDVFKNIVAPTIAPNIEQPNLSLNSAFYDVQPMFNDVEPKTYETSMDILPAISNVNLPNYQTSEEKANISKKDRQSTKETTITININDITLPNVTEPYSFIDELKQLSLSLGVK